MLFCMVALLGIPAFAEVGPEVVPGDMDLTKRAAEMDALHQWLTANEGGLVEAFVVEIPEAKMAELKAAPRDSGRLMVGVNHELGLPVGLDNKHNVGHMNFGADRTQWVAAFRSPGATAMRLHLTNFVLPEGAAVYVYNDQGDAFGPYTGKGYSGNGEQWTHTVFGDEIRLQLHLEGPVSIKQVTRGALFTINEVAHMGENFIFAETRNPTKAFCSSNESCIQNAACSSIPTAIQPAEDAVAHLLFAVGSSQFICSGGLLNDTDTTTQRPLLLTANHCFSSASSASSLEAYFQYTTSCGGSCYNPYSASLPRTVGSTILATNGTSDYTMVELSQSAPAGSVLLGWSSSAVAFSSGTSLYRLSHPKGSPQAYSTHSVNTTAGTCGSWPRGSWIYSDDTFGATEGGSSGSVVLNSSGQVVGQLFGACGTNVNNPCDSASNATVDGAFAVTFSSVSSWLTSTGGGGGCHVGAPGTANYCSSS